MFSLYVYIYIYIILGGCLDVPVPERSALVKGRGLSSKVSICCAPLMFFKQNRS